MSTTKFEQLPSSTPDQDPAGEATSVRALGRRFDGTRSLVALVLGTAIAAAILAAHKLTGTWSEAQVLAGWGVLWAVVLTVLGLVAGSVRDLPTRLVARLDAWAARGARARAEARLWAIARNDARVMAQLTAALAKTRGPAAAAAAMRELSTARTPRLPAM